MEAEISADRVALMIDASDVSAVALDCSKRDKRDSSMMRARCWGAEGTSMGWPRWVDSVFGIGAAVWFSKFKVAWRVGSTRIAMPSSVMMRCFLLDKLFHWAKTNSTAGECSTPLTCWSPKRAEASNFFMIDESPTWPGDELKEWTILCMMAHKVRFLAEYTKRRVKDECIWWYTKEQAMCGTYGRLIKDTLNTLRWRWNTKNDHNKRQFAMN